MRTVMIEPTMSGLELETCLTDFDATAACFKRLENSGAALPQRREPICSFRLDDVRRGLGAVAMACVDEQPLSSLWTKPNYGLPMN